MSIRDLKYRFINKPLADWLGWARKDVLGKHLREVLGDDGVRAAAADVREGAGGRARSSSPPSSIIQDRGRVAVQTDYVPWADARRTGARDHHRRPGRDRAARRRAGAARERGAVPADRQFRAGHDVGDPARPGPRLRQRRLCRVRVRAGLRPRGGADARLACADPSRRRRADRRRKHCRRGVAAAVHARGALSAARRRISLAAGACRSRASGRTASWSASSGSAPTSRSPRRPSSSFAARSRSRPRELARREAQFRAVFEAALEVMVLLEPDGTVLAVNNRREVWRHPEPEEAIGKRLWDAPTHARPTRSTSRDHEEGRSPRRRAGKVFTTEVKMEREGMPTAYLDVSVAAGARARRARSSICCSKRATSPSSRPRRSSFARARRWRRWAS